MFKEDLVLNKLQWLICYKTKPNQTKPNQNLKPFNLGTLFVLGIVTRNDNSLTRINIIS